MQAPPRLLLILTAISFATGGAVIKATTLTGWQIGSFRAGIAAAALLIALPESRRGWSWRLLPAGAAYAATLVLFALSNRLTTSANAIFLQSTAPLDCVSSLQPLSPSRLLPSRPRWVQRRRA